MAESVIQTYNLAGIPKTQVFLAFSNLFADASYRNPFVTLSPAILTRFANSGVNRGSGAGVLKCFQELSHGPRIAQREGRVEEESNLRAERAVAAKN